MKRIIIIFSTVFLGLGLASCGGAASTTGEQETSANDAAANSYGRACEVCHGVDLEGVEGLGTPLTPESLASLSDEEVEDIITNGISGTSMRGFAITFGETEISALVDYIKGNR